MGFHKAVTWLSFQNNIPVFSPALTDGGIGDMFYLFSAENSGFILDIAAGKTVFICLLLNVALCFFCNLTL